MENNGYKRSLQVVITKRENGVVIYTHSYNGMSQFVWDGTTYATLTSQAFALLDDISFAARLAAFEAYVESLESDLDFDNDVVAGYEASILDPVECHLPADYYLITADSEDESLGSTVGTGSYLLDSVATVKAFPLPGVQFDYWEVDNGQPQPNISLQTYTFAVTENVTFTAKFSTIITVTYDAVYQNYICQKIS